MFPMGLDQLFAEMYEKFNSRDADGVLAFMTDNVHWPKAFEGGFVIGKDAVKEYWTRQWSEIDPIVTPKETNVLPDGRVQVTVHQVVRDKAGALLGDHTVFHVYTLTGELVSKMEIPE